MNPHKALAKHYLLVAGLALLCWSCVVEGGMDGAPAPAQPPVSQPAARLGLSPLLRPFYDELEPHGDWVLVEPHGWVFRPRVNTVAWRPYQDGHWEPSYTYGWVWESNEPFGWITDHYGFWFHDDFQGWLWQPYGAWAPSWVAWVQLGEYVGWAPLPPDDESAKADVADGLFTYMPRMALAQAASSVRASYVARIPDTESALEPIDRVVSYRGVSWNAGPPLDVVLGTARVDQLRADERAMATPLPEAGGRLVSAPPAVEEQRLIGRSMRLVRTARAELARARASRGATPGSNAPPAGGGAAPAAPPRIKPAPADTTTVPPDSLRLRKRLAPPQPRKPDGN